MPSEPLKPTRADLETCIKAQNSKLRDMDVILTDVIFAAVTGEGLDELRANRYWRDLSEKERWRRAGIRPTCITGTSISDEAISAWNQRPTDAVLDAEAQALRELEPNWDSYGGSVISEKAIQSALALLRHKPQLTPCSTGGVQIDWGCAGEIYFTPDGEQEFDEPNRKAQAVLDAARKVVAAWDAKPSQGDSVLYAELQALAALLKEQG